MNNIGENLNVLYASQAVQKIYTVPSNLTTTSTTFVDADATNLAVSLTPGKTKIGVMCMFGADLSVGAESYYDLIVGATRIGDATNGLIRVSTIGIHTIFGFASVTPNASTTIKLQYRAGAGATARITTSRPAFLLMAWEI